MLILKLAWRNIWRNKRASSVAIASISIALITLLLFRGFARGAIKEAVEAAINLGAGQIMFQKQGLTQDFKIKYNVDKKNYEEMEEMLRREDGAVNFSRKILGLGLINSARSSASVIILGIEPEREPRVTVYDKRIKIGDYLSGEGGQHIMIGAKMAKKLNVGLGDKVVLTVSALSGEMAADVYRVIGIFETESPNMIDKRVSIIGLKSAQKLFGLDDRISAITARIKDERDMEKIKAVFQKRFFEKGFEIITWKELSPYMLKMMLAIDQFIFFNKVIFFAVVFLVITSILSILIFERIHETGIMMAIGARPFLIFSLLMAETFLVSLLGILIGLAVSFPVLGYFIIDGLDLSVFPAILNNWDLGNIIHFEVTPGDVISICIFLMAAGLIASLYPAYRASRLNPVTAIHHV